MDDLFRDNAAKGRFELETAGGTVYATYRVEAETLYIDYVFAPPALRGSGAAGRLMEKVTGVAQDRGLSITPVCSYAASWLRRHNGPKID